MITIESSVTESKFGKICLVRDEAGIRYLSTAETIPDLNGKIAPNTYKLTSENAQWMRQQFPWLNPQPLGLKTSAGAGDRLGIATSGHLLAFKGKDVAPVLAQQSVRELVRTHRTAQMVMDDAMWGVFEMGWKAPWGADADHLKTVEDMRNYFDAGFTFFTIDPGEHVSNTAILNEQELSDRVNSFPFAEFSITLPELNNRYAKFPEDLSFLTISEADIQRALLKYGAAILFVRNMYLELKGWMNGRSFDFEVSVDETDDPTTPFEHYFIANELKRLGVDWTSLAPRFIGKFEKGVDYQGDLKLFEEEYKRHAAVQKHFGFYKMSLHSGSDKFSIYKISAVNSDYKVHLKTAGTSYLEALRVIAKVDPALFRKIYDLSKEHYDTDKKSYHVSAEVAKMPNSDILTDVQLPDVLNQFDARQALHVCFGTTLDQYKSEIMLDLNANYDLYQDGLKQHFEKHLIDFVK